ncbi:MBL fold metallo-hydrolase [Hujiaoplasma nucleasis]|uniref:MBL fold metallo-hydrolase n=1 Tax=Hujiaoplasma nucleasis TaxID=2725268 RepID=A0A7L6N4M3_9MOLU|nr:MBL fold metallo-hydrolase [Hujiaoplasma nucleasis]QLY39529.1 MBL fold metallo-hydrolase [Hujiaoplasma nucleasis]
MFKIKKMTNLDMDMNSYLLIKQDSVLVIDPGFNGQEILNFLNVNQLNLLAICLTHAHYDHIRDSQMILDSHHIPIYIHERDYEALFNSTANYSKTFGFDFKLDFKLNIVKIQDQEEILIQDELIRVIHTPGHTFGSVMYEYMNHIFSGDTIFYDSIGRTDLFSGNFNAIRRSLNMIKKNISNKKMIWPGHGKNAYLKDIKRINRYLQ